MFDEEDYYSDEEETLMNSNKNIASSKVLVPSSGSDFNHLAGESQSLMKIMKDRGLDLTENQIKKISNSKGKQKNQSKPKQKTGFFDGGDKASIEELIKALNKSFSQADPQQASCILSYLLDKKGLSPADRDKFSLMKCNILFGLGAYEDCLAKSQQFLQRPCNKLSAAIYSNLMAKCKSQTNKLLSGYMDYLRSKSLLEEYKDSLELQKQQKTQKQQKQDQESNEYKQSQIDTTQRQINHTQMQYNIKMNKYKNNTNLIHPFFPEFRHRKILQVVCGDYHTLFLVGGALGEKVVKSDLWANQVFGLGENTVGQITGKSAKVIFKQPVLISHLSGKGIEGIYATRESSLAYDNNGNIYEWGIKQNRNELIQITFTVGEQIQKLQKGYRHYSLLTRSGKFYSWGNIEMNNTSIYNQPKPHLQDSKNIVNFSCGNRHTVAVDSSGNAYSLGANDMFQLGIHTERLAKTFKKIQNAMLGDVSKVFCIHDCTFVVNSDNQVFFCGKYSLKRQVQQKFRQAEFGDDFQDVIAVTGSVGTYYVSNELGNSYKWDVDTMVKFKLDKQNEQLAYRYIEACRSTVIRAKSMIQPELCKAKRVTESLKTYEPIYYTITLKDQFGLYGVKDLVIPPRCQIFLSTYKAKREELQNDNKLFIDAHNFCSTSNKILLNQIVENRLIQFQVNRNEQSPWLADLKIVVESSGRYYFYIIIEESIILEEELEIQVSEQQKELEDKNKQDKLLKEEEKRRKAELQRQRLADQRLRKQQEEEQKRKQTQRRAEQALKKHMREQQEAKNKEQQQRKAKKQLMTGGGFDLSKLKKKVSNQASVLVTGSQNSLSATISEKLSQKILQKSEKVERLQRTGESFLPDINQRPSSRKKVTLPKPSQIIGSLGKDKPSAILKSSITDFSSTGFSIKDSAPITNERGITPKSKTRQSLLSSNAPVNSAILKTSQPKPGGIVKRGLSKKKA